jgi:large subunit ribosomal protein L21
VLSLDSLDQRVAGSIQFQIRRPEIYAIIETGGKQYKVASGQVVEVDKMEAFEGDPVELEKVLLIADNDNVSIGNPVVEGAKVTATCQGDIRTDKILVLHYKPKTRYLKKNGHRQTYTRLLINDIIGPGASAEEEPEKTTRKQNKEEVTEEEVTENGA